MLLAGEEEVLGVEGVSRVRSCDGGAGGFGGGGYGFEEDVGV